MRQVCWETSDREGKRKGQRIRWSELNRGRQGEALQAGLGKSQALGAVGKKEEVEERVPCMKRVRIRIRVRTHQGPGRVVGTPKSQHLPQLRREEVPGIDVKCNPSARGEASSPPSC